MALILEFEIPQGIGTIVDANYRITNMARLLIDEGTVQIGVDNVVSIPMEGKGVAFGDWVRLNVDNENSIAFELSGSSDVKVQVTDDGTTPIPVANFAFTVDRLEYTMINASTGESSLTYLWDFGDGNTSTLESPVHTYATAGSYAISLIAYDIYSGESIPYTQNVDVSELFVIDTVIPFGASIMDRAFSGTFGNDTGEDIARDEFLKLGVVVDIKNRGGSGDTTANMIPALDAVIAEFGHKANQCMLYVHWAGNDISNFGPYPGGATDIDTNCRAMCESIIAAGFQLALSNVTYRIPPASNPSEPYNENVMNAIVDEYAQVASDLYSLTYAFRDYGFDPDGIHHNAIGMDEVRVDCAAKLSPTIKSSPETTYLEDALFQFGNTARVMRLDACTFTQSVFTTNILNKNYGKITGGATASITGVQGSSDGGGVGNTTDPSDSSLSLGNNTGLKSYVYGTSSMHIDLTSAKIDPAGTYHVSVAASRSGTANNSDITVAGTTITIVSQSTPAEYAAFPSVLGSDLIAGGITSANAVGSSFCYFSMISIRRA